MPEASEAEIEGTIETVNPDGSLVVNGITVFIDSDAEVKGNLVEGAQVKLEGSLQEDGTLLAQELKARGRQAAASGTDREIEGLVEDILRDSDGNIIEIVVAGQTISAETLTRIEGLLEVGASVEIEGLEINGQFVATKVEGEEDSRRARAEEARRKGRAKAEEKAERKREREEEKAEKERERAEEKVEREQERREARAEREREQVERRRERQEEKAEEEQERDGAEISSSVSEGDDTANGSDGDSSGSGSDEDSSVSDSDGDRSGGDSDGDSSVSDSDGDRSGSESDGDSSDRGSSDDDDDDSDDDDSDDEDD